MHVMWDRYIIRMKYCGNGVLGVSPTLTSGASGASGSNHIAVVLQLTNDKRLFLKALMCTSTAQCRKLRPIQIR